MPLLSTLRARLSSATRVHPRVSVALLSAVVLGAATALAPPPPAKTTVGFAQAGADTAWRTAQTKSIQDEAEKRGVDLKFADAQGKQAAQIQSIKSFISQKVKYIVLAPTAETGWDEVLKEARKANIPVILIDHAINVADETLYTTLIGSDLVEEGRVAGEWLARKTGGKAGIIELQGPAGSRSTMDRHNGFMEAIGTHKDMKVIRSQSAEFTRPKGKEAMRALLKNSGDYVTALYSHNDDVALGAIRAIEEAGKKPGTDVIIISIDGTKPALDAIAEGHMNATIGRNPLLGPVVFDVIDQLQKGEAVPRFMKQQDTLFERGKAKEDPPKPPL